MITRRDFVKGMAVSLAAVALGINPSRVWAGNQTLSELESFLTSELKEVKRKDKEQFNQDFEWYIQGKDNGSDSKVILLGDYHNESARGSYANLFEHTKKFFDSLAIESADYGDKDALVSRCEVLKKATGKHVSLEECKNDGELTKQLVNSGKILYGHEGKNPNLAHACAIGAYRSIEEMIKCAIRGNLDGVLKYDKEIGRIQNLSPIELPQYDVQMFQNGKFDAYWHELEKVITEDLVDVRSVASANNVADYLKSEESKYGKSVTTGVIYGAAHRHKFLEELDNKGISNIYIGSKKFEREHALKIEK